MISQFYPWHTHILPYVRIIMASALITLCYQLWKKPGCRPICHTLLLLPMIHWMTQPMISLLIPPFVCVFVYYLSIYLFTFYLLVIIFTIIIVLFFVIRFNYSQFRRYTQTIHKSYNTEQFWWIFHYIFLLKNLHLSEIQSYLWYSEYYRCNLH